MEKEKELIPATLDLDSPKIVQTLKSTVAKGATDEEFLMFSQLCKATGLNPFKNEIWFIRTKDRPQIMTGINGYFAVANKNSAYDGMECETSYGANNSPVESVCKVYRKDRKFPAIGKARWAEDAKPYGVWKEKPTLMLEKVAKSRALREAFPQELNGLYTQEEMDVEYQQPQQVTVTKPKPGPLVVWVYNLDLIDDPDKLPAAEKYAADQGATLNDESGQWESPRELKRLKTCLVETRPVVVKEAA